MLTFGIVYVDKLKVSTCQTQLSCRFSSSVARPLQSRSRSIDRLMNSSFTRPKVERVQDGGAHVGFNCTVILNVTSRCAAAR